jgi:hypothetical protein
MFFKAADPALVISTLLLTERNLARENGIERTGQRRGLGARVPAKLM